MTKNCAMGLGVALALAAGVGVLSLRAADDNPVPATVKKLADQVGTKDWADLTKEGDAIMKKLGEQKRELNDIMYVFKLRGAAKNPGIGIGDKPGAITPDGIEAKLNNWAKRGVKVTAKDLQHAAEFSRMAEISAAVAGIVANAPNEKARKKPADVQKWKEYSKEMHDSSLDLIKALKSKGPMATKAAAVKAAAVTLQGTCTKCHGDFRDD